MIIPNFPSTSVDFRTSQLGPIHNIKPFENLQSGKSLKPSSIWVFWANSRTRTFTKEVVSNQPNRKQVHLARWAILNCQSFLLSLSNMSGSWLKNMWIILWILCPKGGGKKICGRSNWSRWNLVDTPHITEWRKMSQGPMDGCEERDGHFGLNDPFWVKFDGSHFTELLQGNIHSSIIWTAYRHATMNPIRKQEPSEFVSKYPSTPTLQIPKSVLCSTSFHCFVLMPFWVQSQFQDTQAGFRVQHLVNHISITLGLFHHWGEVSKDADAS